MKLGGLFIVKIVLIWTDIQIRFDCQSEEIKRLNPFLFDVMTSEERSLLHDINSKKQSFSKSRQQAEIRVKNKIRLRNERRKFNE